MRTARILGSGKANTYHCMSRIIERRMILDDCEKERFRWIMRAVARFAGIEVLTYALMGTHFHILLQVPERKELSEEDILDRILGLYGKEYTDDLVFRLNEYRKEGRLLDVEAELNSYTRRMYDLSQYMKMLMQRYTQSYNRRNNRRGTLWEGRFKSILVEGSSHAITTMGAYIDLNAVRAGMVEDPKEYRFCGYGEAVAGGKEAQQGIRMISEALGVSGKWTKHSRTYRKHLFMQAETHMKGAGVSSRETMRERVETILREGGKLSMTELLRCRLRYFSDGLVLGSKVFVDDTFKAYRDQFGLKRKTGARTPKYGDWGDLCTMRDLRTDPVSFF